MPKPAGHMARTHLAFDTAACQSWCIHCHAELLPPYHECRSCTAAQVLNRSPPALSPRLPDLPAPLKDGAKLKPWHRATYIPEIRLDNAASLRAFQEYDPGNKVAVVNYFDLKESRFSSPKKAPELRQKIGSDTRLILSCTGADRNLEQFSVKECDVVARAVKADAVTTAEDFVYDCDDAHPEFQRGNFLRAKSRTSDLLRISDRPYDIIGLVSGQDRTQQDNYMDFLARKGIRDMAFPCSDYLKGGHPDTDLIDNFVRRYRETGNWAVLLGIQSKRLLLHYKPPSFSNSAPCFEHAHDRSAGNCALDGPVPGAPANLPVERCQSSLRRYASLGARWGA